MSNDLPSAYELGQLVGKYDESMKNINSTLETIDTKLEKGEKKMNGLGKKIDDGFSEQKLENNKIHNKIEKTDADLAEHKKKKHLFKITDEEGRFTRSKRHWLEILLGGSVGTGGVIGLILLLIDKGVI